MKFKFFTLIITVLMIVACKSNKEEWRNPNECDFINERNCIKVNYELIYDIIPHVTYGSNIKKISDIGIAMEIFNYGGMLHINKSAIENIYSSMFAPISHFYVISSEDISIAKTLNDETYGEWAMGYVVVHEFNRFLEDVFISPLAYNYIKKKQNNDNDCLVLVRLISPSNNNTFNGIFYGDKLTELIINSNYQHIVTHNSSFNTNDCGEFWKPLLTDEEHKIYENYLRRSKMGLASGSYKLPRTIVKKIER